MEKVVDIKEKENLMNKFIFERVDSIRFERKFKDGSKASFTVGEPKTLKLENADYLITSGGSSMKFNVYNALLHKWDSVFDPNTQIVILAKIVEVTPSDEVVKNLYGEFDFRELCNGNIVCLEPYNEL